MKKLISSINLKRISVLFYGFSSLYLKKQTLLMEKSTNKQVNEINPFTMDEEFELEKEREKQRKIDEKIPDFSHPKLPRYFQQIPSSKNIKFNIDEMRSAYLFEDLSDLINYESSESEQNENSVIIGNDKTIGKNNFIQLDANKLTELSPIEWEMYQKNLEKNDEIENYDENPKKYFNKILVFNVNNDYYATSSFCGYDLTDLKEGVLLGNKLICSTCLSEYNVENGYVERGPNVKNLASFPVALKKNELILKIPSNQVPLFSKSFHKVYNEVDPRNIVLIGDTETTFGCIDSLLKIYSGHITVITNQTGFDFVDLNKLSKSFFPTKAKHSRFLTKEYINENKIRLIHAKVKKIDGKKRLITLTNGSQIPFDKALISVGSRKIEVPFYENVHALNNVIDHAKIHNTIIDPNVTSIGVVGSGVRALEICCSIRKYLDLIGKDKTRIFLISVEPWFITRLADSECSSIVEDYLKRNRISIFNGIDFTFNESSDKKKVDSLILHHKKKHFQIPADLIVVEHSEFSRSNVDFANDILIDSEEDTTYGLVKDNTIICDDRMSLHNTTRLPFIFAAGNCTIFQSMFYKHLIRTDNVRVNLNLGQTAALNMLGTHCYYDDIEVNSAKVLDKWVHHVGSPNFDKKLIYKNKEKGQFISYLFFKKKLEGCLIFGFKNFHIYFKELQKGNALPTIEQVQENVDEAHKYIINYLLSKREGVKCYKHELFSLASDINTTQYSIADQEYAKQLLVRTNKAFYKFSDTLKKEFKEKKANNENKN